MRRVNRQGAAHDRRLRPRPRLGLPLGAGARRGRPDTRRSARRSGACRRSNGFREQHWSRGPPGRGWQGNGPGELAEGDHRAAHELAMAAAEQAATVVAELEVARARLVAGRALGEIDRQAAIGQLEFVRQLADHCGAQRVHEEAVRELRRLGRRVGAGGPRASGVGELGALSPRERTSPNSSRRAAPTRTSRGGCSSARRPSSHICPGLSPSSTSGPGPPWLQE